MPTATRSPPELTREWEWSERYPGQPEILRYLNHVADRFDLKRDIRFNTRVNVRALRRGGESLAGAHRGRRGLHRAVPDHRRRLPVLRQRAGNFPGLDDFKGRWYHTGQWPHEGVDFTGKRVGMIGTGSTGIQAAPVIAETAAHLTVFQRTANYQRPCAQRPPHARVPAVGEGQRRPDPRGDARQPQRHPFMVAERLALETPPRGAGGDL